MHLSKCLTKPLLPDQVGLDASAATHLNTTEEIKTSWQSSNKMRCFDYTDRCETSLTPKKTSAIRKPAWRARGLMLASFLKLNERRGLIYRWM